ncbi:hypothetical protein BA899_09735 [Spiribacter sp. SSL99]|uniref:tyrosine-type recombinase/integrase n=1 Tax=Spiribacter sp. SSL99 TaxID=1866884 RepID=UPI0013309C96|nr:site-specific integrase [Spiribacter sp. SSL99]KAF0286425.1 hypothetical protein BA899_09735 [Spiribacter sp. SSL99]
MSNRKNGIHQRLHDTAPQYFSEKKWPLYRPYIYAVIAALFRYGSIDGDVLKVLEKRLRRRLGRLGNTHSAEARRRRLYDVLLAANETGDYLCVLPPTPTKVPRPKSVATSARVAEREITAAGMARYLSDWLKANSDDEARCLGLAMRLVSRIGLGPRVVLGTLSRVTPADRIEEATLAIPVDPTDWGKSRYHLPLPAQCRACMPRRTRGAPRDDQTLYPSVLGALLTPEGDKLPDAKTVKAAMNEVRDGLERVFTRFLADFRRDCPEAIFGPVNTWQQFAQNARRLPMRFGIPAAWIEPFRDYPLPASMPPEAMKLLFKRPSHRAQRAATDSDEPPPAIAWPQSIDDPDETGANSEPTSVSPDFASTRLRFIRAFLREAEQYKGQRKEKITKNGLKKLEARRDRLMTNAKQTTPGRLNLAVMAIGWLYSELEKGNKLSTVRTYMYRIFRFELFLMEETLEIRDWDDETVQEVLASQMANNDWDRSTIAYFKQTWLGFLRYCQRLEVLTEVESLPQATAAGHSATRTGILKPFEFGLAWDRLVFDGDERMTLQARPALGLGFCAGLRSKDVLRLTVWDIECHPGELYVHIQRGKTAAARRKIPLHATAPPHVQEYIKAWADARGAEFDGELPQTIPLFGPAGEKMGYEWKAFISPLLGEMQTVFGPGFDFHLLRHSFASWTLLRLHAMRVPTFASKLPWEDDWLFADESLDALSEAIDGERPESPDNGQNDWLHLSKLLGHRDLATTLITYNHLMHWVHADVLDRAYGGRRK